MTILVGYVPKPEGLAALTAGVDEARLRDESLYVVNASKGDALIDASFASPDDLAAVRRTLEGSGVPFQLDQHVAGKGGAEDVLDLADRLDASLIVIGLRRRTPTGKLLTGSNSQRILLEANCPVLAVKAAAAHVP